MTLRARATANLQCTGRSPGNRGQLDLPERRDAEAAVRMFERLGEAEQREAADPLKTRAGVWAFVNEAVMTPQ